MYGRCRQKKVVIVVINIPKYVHNFREWTESHQFRKQLSYDGDLSPCQA